MARNTISPLRVSSYDISKDLHACHDQEAQGCLEEDFWKAVAAEREQDRLADLARIQPVPVPGPAQPCDTDFPF